MGEGEATATTAAVLKSAKRERLCTLRNAARKIAKHRLN
jgi:hypothetical protein